jgi:hypothetical protein
MPLGGREEFGVSQVFDELERDWQRLCGDRRAVARLRDVCAVVGAARPGELERCVEQASRPVADEALLLLVRRAVAGEGLAARVLLQLLLPGVRRLARTWWALGDDDERAAAALSAVWERIQRYPIERRPGRVAANILMDAASDLRRAVRGTELVQASAAVEREPADLQGPGDAATELAEVLVDAIAAGVIDRSDAELIAATRIAGTPLREIAQERAMPLRTAQWRRQRAEAALVTSTVAVA